ncbi:MAG: hypothetical protein JNL32_06735 [Candidatus Kapabacteria bacterium]|nr:hypothetical protein [Candidatus Kapabacteria bacterium]
MNIHFSLLILCITFCRTILHADDPLDYYPHKVGDKWHYTVRGGNTYIVEIIKDSILQRDTSVIYFIEKNDFITYSGYIVNSITKEVYYHSITRNASNKIWNVLSLQFDFSKPVGEKYPRVRKTIDTNGILKYDSVFSCQLFSELPGKVLGRNVMIRRYAAFMTRNYPAVLSGVSYYFAKGIGLVLTQAEETGDTDYLEGCIVNGDTLGDVSKLITSVEEEERQRSDAMAFPNPSSDHIFINTGSMMQREAVIRIVSTSGMEVRPPMRRSATDLYSLDISGLEQGAYTAAVYVGSTVRTVRFAVIR